MDERMVERDERGREIVYADVLVHLNGRNIP